MTKKVLITGITGQDGAYLAKQLLADGAEVYGTVRRGASPKTARLEELGILDDVKLVSLEVTEFANVQRVLSDVRPDRIFSLAAQSFVADSFEHPIYTSMVNYNGVLNILEAIRITGIDTRLYQASTSEMFGEVLSIPQDENTPFNPISPYAIAKLAAHHLVANHRVAYGLHASSGVLFNHESELRGLEFVTRKITSWLAKLVTGKKGPIPLGNFSSVRDWGYAPEYVNAMALIIEADKPEDYVVATNTETSIREFLQWSCNAIDLDVEFVGENEKETCINKKTGDTIAFIDPKYYRPSDVKFLRGSYDKIHTNLGWKPTTFAKELAEIMALSDLEKERKA